MTIKENKLTKKIASNASIKFQWLKKKVQRLQLDAYFLFPNLLNNPDKESREYYEESDRKTNVETRVPTDEKLRTSAIWAVEFFGPSEIDSLYKNLLRLDWNNSRQGSNAPGPIDWIKEQ